MTGQHSKSWIMPVSDQNESYDELLANGSIPLIQVKRPKIKLSKYFKAKYLTGSRNTLEQVDPDHSRDSLQELEELHREETFIPYARKCRVHLPSSDSSFNSEYGSERKRTQRRTANSVDDYQGTLMLTQQGKYMRILDRHMAQLRMQKSVFAEVQKRSIRIKEQEEENVYRAAMRVRSELSSYQYTAKIMRTTRSGERRQARVRNIHEAHAAKIWKNFRIATLARPKYHIMKYADISGKKGGN